MATEYASRSAVISHNHDQTEATAKTVATGSAAEAIAGGAALVLAILGLAGMLPAIMAAIAVIAAGAAFLFQGAGVAARFAYLQRHAGSEAELATGSSSEIVGGIAGITLGILALVGVATMTLLGVSAIVFGGTLLFGSPAVYRVGKTEPNGSSVDDEVLRQTTAGAAGAQALIGIGSATLGILALIGLASQTLVLVAVLAVGAGALLGGGTLTGKMVSLLYH
jgi:hypothetical protein